MVVAVDNVGGQWEWSTDNGATWHVFTTTTGSVVDISSHAIVLDGTSVDDATSKIRFVPDEHWDGSSWISYRAWDMTDSRSSGDTVNLNWTGVGGTTPFSGGDAEIAWVEHHSPNLDVSGDPTIPTMLTNPDPDRAGTSLTWLIVDGSITDYQGNTIDEAIAITGVDNTYGVWKYSLDAGTTWLNITDEVGRWVDLTTDTLLLDCPDNSIRIRFDPGSDWTGTSSFEYRAWDKTDGRSSGDTADLTITGDRLPTWFSDDAAETMSVLVLEANDAPTDIDLGNDTVVENQPAGTTVGILTTVD